MKTVSVALNYSFSSLVYFAVNVGVILPREEWTDVRITASAPRRIPLAASVLHRLVSYFKH